MEYGKGSYCYYGHFQGFLQGSWPLIRTKEDMGVNINHDSRAHALFKKMAVYITGQNFSRGRWWPNHQVVVNNRMG